MKSPILGAVLLVSLVTLSSCSKPRELGGQYSGIGIESATVDHGGKVTPYRRAPGNETVTVMRDAGTALRIRFGSCELPATARPDGIGAKINAGAMCTVNGEAGIPMSGAFHSTEAVGGGLSVLIVGGGPTADGKTTYSFSFTGTRLPR